jgi:transposase
VRLQAERALTRFETPPGLQSQIDGGEARVYFGQRCVKEHLLVLTLGYSGRALCAGYANEQLGTFLEAHEHAFEHFGGHPREHL